MRSFWAAATTCVVLCSVVRADEPDLDLPRIPGARRYNVILILTDDHRWDAFGFMGRPYLETPNMDRVAKERVHGKNAFVTTSLCSPGRVSILTGVHAYRHRVINNCEPTPGLIRGRDRPAAGRSGRWLIVGNPGLLAKRHAGAQ